MTLGIGAHSSSYYNNRSNTAMWNVNLISKCRPIMFAMQKLFVKHNAVLCNIVCNNCAQCNAHTYEQTNSSLD